MFGLTSRAQKSKLTREISTTSYSGQFVCHSGPNSARVPATIQLKNKKLSVDLKTSAGGRLRSPENPLNIWEELLLTVDYRGHGFRPGQASHVLGLHLVGNLDSRFLATLHCRQRF